MDNNTKLMAVAISFLSNDGSIKNCFYCKFIIIIVFKCFFYKEMQIDTQDKYDYLVSEIKKSHTRKDKLLDMYMDGDVKKDVWAKKTQDIENQISLLKNQLKTLKQSRNQFIDNGKNIIEYSKQAYNLYKKQNTEEKRKLLHIMFEKITIKNRMVNFIYKKPFCYFAQCNLKNADEIIEYIKTI